MTETPIYEDGAAIDWWFKALIVATIAATFIPGLAIVSHQPLAGWLLLGTTVFDGLLFHVLLPRRFRLYSDRLRVVLGYPFAFSVRLDTIKEARAVSSAQTLFNTGLRMATSPSHGVEVRRRGGSDLMISPMNRELFLEQVNGALRRK